MIWTHLFDTHIPFTYGVGRGWQKDAPNWIARAGHSRNIAPVLTARPRPHTADEWHRWKVSYDASVCFVDHHIGLLRRGLEQSGLADTLIVLASDHGEELGDHGDVSHKFRLYEHNTHVNTLFFHPDLAETSVPGFATTMDIAPTIADFAGVPCPAGWEGSPVSRLRTHPRQQVLLETTFGSPSDASCSPVYFAVREAHYKLMHIDRVHALDPLSRQGTYLYNLLDDPAETTDVSSLYPAVVQRMLGFVASRCKELGLPVPASSATEASEERRQRGAGLQKT